MTEKTTVKLEVEGEPDKMDALKARLESSQHVESVEWVDQVSDHELDTIELAVTMLRDKGRSLDGLTVNEVADQAGMPVDEVETGLAELGCWMT